MKLTKKERARVSAVTRTLLGIGDWRHHETWAYLYSRAGVELGHLSESVGRYDDHRVIAWSAAHGHDRLYFPTKDAAMQWIESTYYGKG